jgi:cobalt-precorrin-5B (C1)-methyltransferase
MTILSEFDITRPADNGMRRGRTTGTCGAAAAKAAAFMLEYGQRHEKVQIALPDAEHFLTVPIAAIEVLPDGAVQTAVIKEAGDDPDATDGATITCVLRRNQSETMRFFAGKGVGIVTEPGMRVSIGEPAINPVPRQMIVQAIVDAIGDGQGFDITIGCTTGEEIAKKTFNPRLGVKGGISILGTTGIVEPLSLAAYMASIEVYLNVALAEAADAIALLPGNIGLGFAGKNLKLPKKRVVHISNYLGFSLEHIGATLAASGEQLADLWVLGHPGKLAKVLDGNWDTHSRVSRMAMAPLAAFAADCGVDAGMVASIGAANTVEEIIKISETEHKSSFWLQLETKLSAILQDKVGQNVSAVHVKLFDMSARELTHRGGGQSSQ